MNENSYRLWDTILKGAGMVGVVVTLGFGAYQHSSGLEKEYKKPFYELQLKTCSDAVAAASAVARESAGGRVSDKKINRLFFIYYSAGPLVLNNSTLEALGKIGSLAIKCNAKTESQCLAPIFNDHSTAVAKACRDMLAISWDDSLKNLNSNLLLPNLAK